MQIRILKDFKWSHSNRIVSYKKDQIIEVTSKDAESMIKHEYAEHYTVSEAKMFQHEVIEDKMVHFEIENKTIDRSANRRSRKQKEVENE